MRILMLVYNQTGKGTYWRAMGFAQGLARKGHNVVVVSTSPTARLRVTTRKEGLVQLIESPDLLFGPLRSGWDLWNVQARIRFLKELSFDIVHAFETRPVVIWPALAVTRKKNVKLVLDWADWFGRGGAVEERPNPLIRNIVRPVETFFETHYRLQTDYTTVINSYLRQKALACGVPAESIHILHNGSNVAFKPIDMHIARQQSGLPNKPRIIGFVGGTYHQDARFMALAYNQVLSHNPNVKLLLVGYFNRPIENWVIRPETIIRTGPLSLNAIYTYLSACDICWLPLRDSGANRGRLPFKLNDYMTVARPTVATDVGDLRMIVEQNRLGVIARPNIDDFAKHTLELLQNPAQIRAMGLSARKAAETVFSWNKLATKLEGIYLKILANRC